MNDLNQQYPIHTTPVSGSSIISEIQYDTMLNSLRITFTNGTEYDYAAVEEDMYNQLTEAHSVGQFFHSNIKGKYEYSRKVKKSSTKQESQE